jgi:excinuclease ABC subunit B
VRGDTIDVFPAEHSELAIRIELFDDEIESLQLFDPLTGRVKQKIPRFTVYPSSHYVTPRDKVLAAVETIKLELAERLKQLVADGKLVEAQRLEQRTRFDLEMLSEVGHCKGIENYTRHLSGAAPGDPPSTLTDYMPKDAIMFLDESHQMIGQLRPCTTATARARPRWWNMAFACLRRWTTGRSSSRSSSSACGKRFS